MSRYPSKGISWHMRPSKNPLSLRIRVFIGRSMGSQGSNFSSGEKLRLWSDCADAQADLNLRSTHIPTCNLVLVSNSGDLRLSGSIIRKSRFIFTKEWRTIRQKSGCLNPSNERIFQVNIQMQGWIIDCWKGMWGSLCWFISSILNIPWKWNNLVSVRPNYFIFIGF